MKQATTVGLIAGEGRFPLLYTEALQAAGIRPVAVGFAGETDPALEGMVTDMTWLRLGKLGPLAGALRQMGAEEAVMVGKISKTNLYRRLRPDLAALKLLTTLKNHNDDSMLLALTEYLEREGVTVVDSQRYVPGLITPPGTMCGRLSTGRKADLVYGWRMAMEIGRLDIGQSVVVRRQAILAVEAIEGTDETIRRGGRLGRGSAVVVKVAKPAQDMRFDVPLVGLRTVETMIETGCTVLGIEAGRSFFIDREESLRKAAKHRLALVGLTPGMIGSWEKELQGR
jgi:DUF1009 family protein